MRTWLDTLKKRADDLEGRLKRNVIIYGIQKHENETRQECEELVREMITNKLELAHTTQFDRVQRLNAKSICSCEMHFL